MSDDQSFFEELRNDFLNEIAFLLETYEENMLGLENGDNKHENLTQIFRVAHSIKGGAAAVGFNDFSHFAHKVEDLLSILRANPELVNSQIISILLESGDQFTNRVKMLKQKDTSIWDVSSLENRIKEAISKINPTNDTEKDPTSSINNEKIQTLKGSEAQPLKNNEVDHTNYDLLKELMESHPELKSEMTEKANDNNSSNNSTSAVNNYQDSNPLVKSLIPNTNSTNPNLPGDNPGANLNLIAGNKNKISEPDQKQTTSKNISKVNQIIKVDTARVDNVLDAVGELVVLKNQIVHDDYITSGGNPQLASIVDQLDKAVRELYDKTLSIRMTPLKSLYLKIQRIVRDVSISLDKPVNLQLIGEETEVERTVFELLNDPLVHLVRNAMDHGVEKRETRKQNNKPEIASVTVQAKQMGGNVIIDIIDDGGGINKDRVLSKALEKKLIPSEINPNQMPDEDIYKLIFAPGFSTAEKISDLSGRGVGLDVVKSNIEKVNGKINIFSKQGQGSTFRLTIPLSTAITDGIVVMMKSERYILPIYTIREIIRLNVNQCTQIPGKGSVARVRDSLLPIADLDYLFHELKATSSALNSENQNNPTSQLSRKKDDEVMLVIIETSSKLIAIPVDDVLGQTQVVVKSLSIGQNIPEVSGAAILGDGRTVLILDPYSIIRNNSYEVAI